MLSICWYGIPIPSKPSEPARVEFFSPVLADIGDLQSVDGNLSTFSGQLLVCRVVLTDAGADALVLMDELGSGTDPNQGVAIARTLLDRGCRVAITTHYMELKQLASTDDRFPVVGMQFVGGRPTYMLDSVSVILCTNELLDTERESSFGTSRIRSSKWRRRARSSRGETLRFSSFAGVHSFGVVGGGRRGRGWAR